MKIQRCTSIYNQFTTIVKKFKIDYITRWFLNYRFMWNRHSSWSFNFFLYKINFFTRCSFKQLVIIFSHENYYHSSKYSNLGKIILKKKKTCLNRRFTFTIFHYFYDRPKSILSIFFNIFFHSNTYQGQRKSWFFFHQINHWYNILRYSAKFWARENFIVLTFFFSVFIVT